MKVEKVNDEFVLTIPKLFTGKQVRDAVIAVRDAKQMKMDNLTIDLGQTEFIDSSGIGVLVSFAKEFRSDYKPFKLKNLREPVSELFAETGLDIIFDIITEEGVDEASVDLFEQSIDVRLEINTETKGPVCVFHLNGVMNHPRGSRYFKQQFLLAIAEHKYIVLDFENLTFFDSLSVSVILNMNKLLKETGGSMRLCGANYIIDDLFSTLNISRIIPLYDTVEFALENWVYDETGENSAEE